MAEGARIWCDVDEVVARKGAVLKIGLSTGT
jgi:hypothetical protein